MERNNRFTLHIAILSLALILVDLSTTVECLKKSSRKRNPDEPGDFHLAGGQARRELDAVNSTMACALSLAGRRLEVCELAWKINQLQDMLPHLQSLIANRLGRRNFSFTIYINRPSSTIQLLDEVGRALLKSIGRFIQFLGYVEKLFEATVGGSQVLQEPGSRRGLYRSAMEAAGFSKEIADIDAVNEDEVQRLIQRAWSRKCILELLKSDKNLCDVINRITALDGLLQGQSVNVNSKELQLVPIKLYSESLNLIDFLDAIHSGLVLAMTNVHTKAPGVLQKSGSSDSIPKEWKSLNAQDHEVKEVFQTPEFKVELIQPQSKNNHDKKEEIANSRRQMQPKMLKDEEESTEERKDQSVSSSEDDSYEEEDTDEESTNDEEYEYIWNNFRTSEEVKTSASTQTKGHANPKKSNKYSVPRH
ncbi:uncharacterized protein [Fopius arisanus]|uniref:Uncharacterized protein n=1 Tax=Fopius arisanus TaxID=64838 RepID=A0A9R1TWN8_9HYME|nr:PREDICTED: uncharacterized protein LOC105264148 [Fopius arisanus]